MIRQKSQIWHAIIHTHVFMIIKQFGHRFKQTSKQANNHRHKPYSHVAFSLRVLILNQKPKGIPTSIEILNGRIWDGDGGSSLSNFLLQGFLNMQLKLFKDEPELLLSSFLFYTDLHLLFYWLFLYLDLERRKNE